MSAPEIIKKLVARFDEFKDDYLDPSYKELQVCDEFINPMFEALGWDVHNKEGFSGKHQEVTQQYSLKIGGTTKAPDYAFKIGAGKPIFFVEAKKPSVDLKKDPKPAHQLRVYAWSSKLDISVLTDFQEFAIYDTRIRYHKDDPPSTARPFYTTYDKYIDRWDEIENILGRKNIPKNSIEKFLKKPPRHGAEPVDKVFLDTIELWRDNLAHNIFLYNDHLSVTDLNMVVQKTIDRILFLRICEDRGIEPESQLQSFTNGNDTYSRLLELFQTADDRYNSGLFHFTGKGADELTPQLKISDKYLKDIINALYYPESPYDFNALPADILGQVYEQFLGKVIRVTSKDGRRMKRPKIEEKPEVRKAGGVYYTPTYIVDYIVENTIGKLVENKNPDEISKLKILDPACGSGSFLLGAYQYLLDWYLNWYTSNNPENMLKKKNSPIEKTRKDTWKLTTEKKKEILTNNIFGVDIDSQAVEVTKLNLLLKVLEGETAGRGDHRRLLPNLASNIKCGNSLIEWDYFDGKPQEMDDVRKINPFDWDVEFPDIIKWLLPPSSRGEDLTSSNQGGLKKYQNKHYIEERLKTYDFVYNGKHLPYSESSKEIAQKLRKNQTKAEKKLWYDFLREQDFRFKRQHPIDNYIVDFFCTKIGLVIEIDGETHNEHNQFEHDKKRTKILENYGLKVIRFSNEEVLKNFEGVCEMISKVLKPPRQAELAVPPRRGGLKEPLNSQPPVKGVNSVKDGIGRLEASDSRQLAEGFGFDAVIGNPPYGTTTDKNNQKYFNTKFVQHDIEFEKYILFIQNSISILNTRGMFSYIIPNNIMTNIRFESIRRYILNHSMYQLMNLGSNIFTQAKVDTCLLFVQNQSIKQNILTFKEFPTKDTKPQKYQTDDFFENPNVIFNIYKTKEDAILLKKISSEKMRMGSITTISRGVEFGYKSDSTFSGYNNKHPNPLVAGRCIERYNLVFEDRYIKHDPADQKMYKSSDIYVHDKILVRRIGYSIIATLDKEKYYNVCDVYNVIPEDEIDLHFLLGIINSKVLRYYMIRYFKNQKILFPKISKTVLREIPIRTIDPENPDDKAKHDKMVNLVETMLSLNKKLAEEKSSHTKELLKRQIENTDRKIDELVYDLYNLTPEEIQIVEDSFKK